MNIALVSIVAALFVGAAEVRPVWEKVANLAANFETLIYKVRRYDELDAAVSGAVA